MSTKMYILQSNFTHRKTTDLKTHEEIDLQMLNLSRYIELF